MFKKLVLVGLIGFMTLGIISSVYAQVETHGFLLARTIIGNNNYTARVERYGLQFKEKFNDEFDWLTEIYFHPQITASAAGRLYLESAFLNWHLKKRLPWDFNVRIGKGRNFSYGITPSYSSRRTTDYSLYSEAFTQLRVVGFQTFSNFGNNIQLAVALINPYTFASRQLPDFPIADFVNIPVCDRDTDDSKFNRVAGSGRLGFKNSLLNVGADFYVSDPKKGTDGAKTRLGLDGEVKLKSGLIAQGQFTMAKTQLKALGEDMDHFGAEGLVGWEKNKVGLYARYGMMSYDDKLQDVNSIMLSAVYKILPRVHLRLEGIVNGEKEDTAKKWAKVDNDVVFFETMFAW